MADPLRPSGPQIPGSLMGEIQSEVAVEATPLLSFVLRNSRIIVTCIVLLVLVIAGVGGWQWHQTRVEREAHLELGRILAGPGTHRRAGNIPARCSQRHEVRRPA